MDLDDGRVVDDGTPIGPLAGLRIIELAGIGPVQFAGMMFADLGADIVRVDRPGGGTGVVPPEREVLHRNRPSIAVDLKAADGPSVVQRMVDQVDVVLESYRPGVAERLGVGPDDCLARNPRLVYARMTGWGQAGPLAARAGHDINYLAITGALAAIGERDRKPVPPLNLVADFGGGGMLLVAGVLAALFERVTSGRGQVVDAAMVDGASYLMSMTYSWLGNGLWQPGRGRNILDGGAPYYDTYECSDGRYVAVGAIEPQFFECLISTLGLNDVPPQQDREQWPRLRAQLAETFRQKARDEWAADFAGLDACVTPVLDVDEAPAGSHLDARGTFTTQFGVTQPQPAPRFSRTPPSHRSDPHPPGADSRQVLADFGFTDEEVARLVDCRVVAPRD